jgi:hypothetical protein
MVLRHTLDRLGNGSRALPKRLVAVVKRNGANCTYNVERVISLEFEVWRRHKREARRLHAFTHPYLDIEAHPILKNELHVEKKDGV